MPPKQEPQSVGAPGEPLPLDRALEVGDSFLLRAHAGRQRRAVAKSFVACHMSPHASVAELPPLAAVALQDNAIRFTVKSATPLARAAPELRAAAAVAGRAASLENARVVALKGVGPRVLLRLMGHEDGARAEDEEESVLEGPELVALPLAGTHANGTPLAQLFLMTTTPDEAGQHGWLTASEVGRGQLDFATVAKNPKVPSGWEAFDIVDLVRTGPADADAAGHMKTPVKTPPVKRRRRTDA